MTRRSRPPYVARRADPRSGGRWSAPTPRRRGPPDRRTRPDTARSGTPHRSPSPATWRRSDPTAPSAGCQRARARAPTSSTERQTAGTASPPSIVAIVVTGRSEARNRRSGLVRVASAAGTSVRTTTRRASSSSRSNASVSACESPCSNTVFVSCPVAACGSHCGPGMAGHVVGDHHEAPVGRAALHRELHDERSGDGRCIVTDDRDGRAGIGREVDLDRHVAQQRCGFDDGPQVRAERVDVDPERELAPGRAPTDQHPKRVAVGGSPRPEPRGLRNAEEDASPDRFGDGAVAHRRQHSQPVRWRIACTPRRRDGVSDGDRAPRGPARYPPRPAPRSTRPRRATRTSVGEGPSRSRSIRTRLTTAPVTPHPPTTDSAGGDGGMIGATGSATA